MSDIKLLLILMMTILSMFSIKNISFAKNIKKNSYVIDNNDHLDEINLKIIDYLNQAKSRIYFFGLPNERITNHLIALKKNSLIILVVIPKTSSDFATSYKDHNHNNDTLNNIFNKLKKAYIPSAIKYNQQKKFSKTSVYSILIDSTVLNIHKNISSKESIYRFSINKSSNSENTFLKKFFKKVKFSVKSGSTKKNQIYVYNYKNEKTAKPLNISSYLPKTPKWQKKLHTKELKDKDYKKNNYIYKQKKIINYDQCLKKELDKHLDYFFAIFNDTHFIYQRPLRFYASDYNQHLLLNFNKYIILHTELICKKYKKNDITNKKPKNNWTDSHGLKK